MTKLSCLPASSSVGEIMSVIAAEGYCIIEKLMADSVTDRLLAEMTPFIEASPTGTFSAAGTRTRRSGALLGRSLASRDFVMHPLVLSVAKALICERASTFQLSLTQIISIEPGEPAQFLHRDETAWDYFEFPRDHQVELSTIWALDDFSDLNGATRVVPKSHLSDRLQTAFIQEETLPVEMPRGSVLLYTGKTVHGGGANRSSAARRAANVDYCAGWLRQEENQYLSVPLEVARSLDDDVLKVMGYQMGGGAAGYVRDFEEPIVAVRPERGQVPLEGDTLTQAAKHSAVARQVLEQFKRAKMEEER